MSKSNDAGTLRYAPHGGRALIVATAAQTNNAHFVLEITEPPGGGPPLHMHTREDEFFLVLEGEITFWVDGKVVVVPAGSCGFGPRGIPHTFNNSGDISARMLVVCTPGDIEGFFEYGNPDVVGHDPSDEVLIQRIQSLGPAYGIQVLGLNPLQT